MPPAIGFPATEGIYVSKSDWSTLVARDVEIRNWMTAAARCLEARK